MIPTKIICLLLLITSFVSAECPAGYEVVGSKCIHRLTDGYLTYEDAVVYCYQHFGKLPVLSDCASFTDVATYVDDGYSESLYMGYWLGATDASANNVWQWNDGTPVYMGAPYWAVNIAGYNGWIEPGGGTNENCAVIALPRGWLLNDAHCSTSSTVYSVCSRTPMDGLCTSPYVLVGTQCIHLLLTDYNWGTARTQCGATGGDLVILDDCDQYIKVAAYLEKQGHDETYGY
ncbi:C-type lectin domain family 6 member A isoform X2 [Hyalella azteca]|uniref:C-type lectin domain family 6 member A isoform X2 n=1 Tax=Hyalella azteca TaxID=294128 RepID=A0A8B7NIY6_HYAAZ|nr:C-type lectin domain family 6 member A isoform X2 [Hyalella azteca]